MTAADGPQDITFDATATLSTVGIPSTSTIRAKGFPRDANPAGLAGTQCYVNGIMNAVELDVGNLNKWLQGTIPGGWPLDLQRTERLPGVLLGSPRHAARSERCSCNVTTGEYGFEDVINSASPTGTPDGVAGTNRTDGYSPEDVDENKHAGQLGRSQCWKRHAHRHGRAILIKRVDCLNGGRQNIVTGARHVLRLVDGGLNNLPVRPDNGLGGFTVASENPVYVFGKLQFRQHRSFLGQLLR